MAEALPVSNVRCMKLFLSALFVLSLAVAASAAGKLKVVSFSTILTEVAEHVGSDQVEVIGLVKPGVDPHEYEPTPADLKLVGGADVPFKDAVARDLLLPRQVRKLQQQYAELFGAEMPPIAYAWAGSFAETRDGLPFIGRVPGLDPRLLFALCYGGNGITYSVHAGDMIRAGIEGREHPLDAVFGFGRMGTDLSAGRQRGVASS